MNKKYIITICVSIFLLAIIILIWAPWMSKEFIENRIQAYYIKKDKIATDGCSIKCADCGIVSYEKKIFSVNVIANVKCGLTVSNQPIKVYPKVYNFGVVGFRNIE